MNVVGARGERGIDADVRTFDDPLAASRASRCDDLVRQSGAPLWIHGGRHPVDQVVGGTPVVSRPLLSHLPASVKVEVRTGQGRRSPSLEVQPGPERSGDAVAARTPVQADLFGIGETSAVEPRATCAKTVRHSRRPASLLMDVAAAARLLDADDDHRVLRRVRPRAIAPAYRLGPGEGIASLVDVEITGLDHRHHEVIEIGMVAFAHGADGRIGPVVGTLGMLQEPKGVIGPEITRLTGIGAEMVVGKVIDVEAVRALVERVDLVVAHNAEFDRAFCEGLDDSFRHKPWACSVAKMPWRELGFEAAKLGYLVNVCGLFHDGHRAVDDCHALLEVLAHEVEGASAFSHLLHSSRSTRVRVWAERAPFAMKDVLKARGYRRNGGGDGRPKAWWTEVDDTDLDAELWFLERDVHIRAAELRRDVLTAHERYRPG